MTAQIDLSRPTHIHIVGVGGAGMSGIASVLHAMGHRVTGSDLKTSPAVERLRATGVEVSVGHDESLVAGAEALTMSSAVPASNPELARARLLGIPVLSRADTLAAICSCRRCVAVSGTHGKTTTTSMLSLILLEAGLRPSFLIGGDVNTIGTNAVWDSGEWLVVEADESDGTFLELDPAIAVVTNVEEDHLDHYGTFEALVEAFDRFCASATAAVVVSADDPVGRAVGARHGADTVGTDSSATYRLTDVSYGAGGASFELIHRDLRLGRVELPVLGANIAQNAAMSIAAAIAVGAPFAAAASALARFAGVARRYESRGEAQGVRFVDDYAHLPTEVASVLSVARGEGSRVVVVFQPHRYSRVAALFPQFADAFVDADVVVVTDVFGAGEAPVPGVTGRLVADAVRGAHPGADVHYVAARSSLVVELGLILRPGDLCLTLGAGDLTSLADEMMAAPAW